MSLIEWLGFATGVVCVFLIVKEKDYNWPIGVLNSLILLYIFWQQKLWATVGLQAFYTLECLYGWWMWTRRDRVTGRKIIRIGQTPKQTQIRLAIIGTIGVALLVPILNKTGDPYPVADAIIGIGSLVAEYMLCLKLRQAWHLYFVLDLMSLVVLALLGAWITFGTYLVFSFLCVMGMVEWWKRYRDAVKDSAGELALATGEVP